MAAGNSLAERAEQVLRNVDREERSICSAEETAQNVATFIVSLYDTLHDASKEEEQMTRIQRQVERVNEVEIRDAETYREHIQKISAYAFPGKLQSEAALLLDSLMKRRKLVRTIQDILYRKDKSRIDMIAPLIRDIIREAQENLGIIRKEESALEKVLH